MAASLSFAFKKIRFKYPIYYREIAITINSKTKLIAISLNGVTNTRRLHFMAKDAKLVLDCVAKALKIHAQVHSLQIKDSSIILCLKF